MVFRAFLLENLFSSFRFCEKPAKQRHQDEPAQSPYCEAAPRQSGGDDGREWVAQIDTSDLSNRWLQFWPHQVPMVA